MLRLGLKFWGWFIVAVLSVVGMGAAIASGGGLVWGYEGDTGPTAWGDLSTAFQACKAGLEQSPINIENAVESDLREIEFDYGRMPLNIVNNGHTIQVNATPGNAIELDGETYELLQFHFHHPSEHTVNDDAYPMEMHLVHQNAKAEYAVVGVFLTEGAENLALKPIWAAMPRQASEAAAITGVEVEAAALLPADISHVKYYGSLTTPPCSETVKWVVMDEPIEVSPAQIERFSRIFPHNARPTQPLNRRFVLHTD